MTTHPLVERQVQVRLVQEALAVAAAEGTGRVFALEAPAGAGKTVLLDEIRRPAEGCTVLNALADEYEAEYGWGVVLQLFERHLRSLPAAERGTVLEGPAATVGALLADGLRQEPFEAPAIHHGLYWLVANLSDRRPLLLVVDDVQWADAPSTAALAYVARRVADLPVVLVLAGRAPTSDERWWDRLLADPRTQRIELPPLTGNGVAEVVRHHHPEASERLVSAVLHASGGSPFLVDVATAMLRDSTDEDLTVHRLVHQTPDGLLRIVDERLTQLDAPSLALVRSLAVVGVSASLEVAIAILRESPDPLDRTAVAAAVATLESDEWIRLDDVGRIASFHPLVRSAIVAGLPVPLRDDLHLRAMRALAELDHPPEEIATQALAVGPRGSAEIVDVLLLAATRARRAGAARVAHTLLRRAIVEPPERHQKAPVTAQLAKVAASVGADDTAELFDAAADAAPTPHEQASLLLAGAHALLAQRRFGAAVRALDRAAELDHGEEPSLATELRATHHHLLRLDPDRRDAWWEVVRSASWDDLTFDTPVARAVAADLAYARAITAQDYDRCRATALEVIAGPRGVDLAFDDPLGWSTAMHVLHIVNAYRAARSVAIRVSRRAAEAGAQGVLGLASTYLALMNVRLGLFDDAITALGTVEVRPSDGRSGPRDYLAPMRTATLAYAYLGLGRVEDAADAIAPFVDIDLRADLFAGTMPEVQGWILLAQDRPREALQVVSPLEGPSRATGAFSPATNTWRSIQARALWLDGQFDESRRVSGREVTMARSWGAPRALGIALTTAGMVQPGAAGLARFDEAVDVLCDGEDPVHHGWALYERGRRRSESGDRSGGGADLDAALSIAEELHAGLLGDRVRVAIGGRRHRRPRTGVEALTPAELRVATAAAAGRPNAEIAAELFVSRKAVEFHLSNAYRKLAISGRRELDRALG